MREEEIFKKIENDLRIQKKDAVKESPGEMDSKWKFLTSNEPGKFINKDLTLKKEVLRNFRKYSLFIPDTPDCSINWYNPRNLIDGLRRALHKFKKECFNVIKENGYEYLLRKYPINRIGNPYFYKYKGYEFSYRWTKHIYTMGLFNKFLAKKIGEDFIHMDIGSSYGIFTYLLKKEKPKMTSILLDFPEQLILAHYFLGVNFPDAKIAGYEELKNASALDRNFFKQYDFVLIPWFKYQEIAKNSIDLISNFASFGEMSRKWFEFYIKNEPFLSTKYLLTENRFQSYPTYDTDLTILDYPLKKFEAIHFGICPIFSHTYIRKHLIFSEKVYFSSQYFEFIGERTKKEPNV